jgi:hypothetical protein
MPKASQPDSPRWEEVLAECEATAAAAERLLDHRAGLTADELWPPAALDLWQLGLPPLPAALRERALAVHRRQQQLQAELSAELTSLACQIQMSSASEPASGPPRFLDRSA